MSGLLTFALAGFMVAAPADDNAPVQLKQLKELKEEIAKLKKENNLLKLTIAKLRNPNKPVTSVRDPRHKFDITRATSRMNKSDKAAFTAMLLNKFDKDKNGRIDSDELPLRSEIRVVLNEFYKKDSK